MSNHDIDPTAIVSPKAEIAEGVVIGPYTIIGDHVRIGAYSRIGAHLNIDGETEIGRNCLFYPFSSVGTPPQDLKFKGERTKLRIGDDNVFREFITVNVGTSGGGGITTIGGNNFFMAYTHIAHDCHIGDHTVFGNAATLAGHVDVEDYSSIGAFTGVHQFCRVGKHAFIGGYSVITQDALPYMITVGGRPAASHGPNVIGLQRREFRREIIDALKKAYLTMFRSSMPMKDALQKTETELGHVQEIRYLCDFIRTSKRGVTR